MRNKEDEKIILEIANKFREARLKKRLKQSEVAEKAGLNSNYYAKVERGEATPSVLTIKKILDVLGMKSSTIF